ncbi:MAG: hypothetical protein ACI4P8_04230, partial [Akkermansia sp.]
NSRAREGRDFKHATKVHYIRLFQLTRPRGARLASCNVRRFISQDNHVRESHRWEDEIHIIYNTQYFKLLISK